MYEDQYGEFICGYWGLKVSIIYSTSLGFMLQKLFWLSGTYTSMVLFIGKQVSSYSVVHMSNIVPHEKLMLVVCVNTAASTL